MDNLPSSVDLALNKNPTSLPFQELFSVPLEGLSFLHCTQPSHTWPKNNSLLNILIFIKYVLKNLIFESVIYVN